MRAHAGRTKKLIVAFHFHLAQAIDLRAAWKCDECRRQHLEVRRNCGWIPGRDPAAAPVWARNGIVATQCPVSLVTGEHEAWIDDFHLWKLSGGSLLELPARTGEAFLILEQELRKERYGNGPGAQ